MPAMYGQPVRFTSDRHPYAVLLLDGASRLHFAPSLEPHAPGEVAPRPDAKTACRVATDQLDVVDEHGLTVYPATEDRPLRVEGEGVGELCTICYPAARDVTAGR